MPAEALGGVAGPRGAGCSAKSLAQDQVFPDQIEIKLPQLLQHLSFGWWLQTSGCSCNAVCAVHGKKTCGPVSACWVENGEHHNISLTLTKSCGTCILLLSRRNRAGLVNTNNLAVLWFWQLLQNSHVQQTTKSHFSPRGEIFSSFPWL